jgi:phosphoesterase RecJ-like protein
MNQETLLSSIATVLKEGNYFLITTHRDPDVDGIGSMLALCKALLMATKDVILLTEEPVSAPFDLLKGANRIVQSFDSEKDFDAVVVLDCAEVGRLGALRVYVEGCKPLINIDHHETNDFFGDLNLVDTHSSSTGELVFNVIKAANLPMDHEVAENIFAAIQGDTGSFRYVNTTSASLKIAAEMMKYGVKPWDLSLRVMDGYSLSRLRLLELALGTIELHHKGKIGMMTLSTQTFKKAEADLLDSERFVDYPRFVSGVEIAVLIRQTGENEYKFSLRSNCEVNVAQLASLFGGGGHARAAGFECHESFGALKKAFLKEASRFLDGSSK